MNEPICIIIGENNFWGKVGDTGMYEQEKRRTMHLLLLLVYTFFSIALVGESLLMNWEKGAIVLLVLAMAVSWFLHVTEIVPETIRLWIYFILMMLSIFFYGIHETSVFDLAVLVLVVIILFSFTEQFQFVRICMVTYYLTMLYDFIFVVNGKMEMSSLNISRIMLHFLVVAVAGRLVREKISRRSREQKEMDEKISNLEEENRRTEDFLTNVSHELRTPINAVTGITASLLKKENDPEKCKDIRAIETAGKRLFSQIGDILDFTEIDTGRMKISEENYMISSLMNDLVVGNSGSDLNHKNLELIFDVDTGIPSVMQGDEKKLKKILQHLIDNALKFTQRGGVYVRVFTLKKSYGVNLCIKVTDTGIGISQEELEKIKEHFYQANGGRDRRAGGLGLGLSIVYGMVSAMDGFIQIESQEGKGTTVSVSIPQKVVDCSASVSVENQNKICAVCYLSPENYEVPEVRDFYNDMIEHIVHGLDVTLYRATKPEELRKLEGAYKLTHIFAGQEEYEQDPGFFVGISPDTQIVVVAGDDFAPESGSRVKLLKKPFHCLAVAKLLDTKNHENETEMADKYMVCPGIRVLVVDDEPMNLMVAEEIFKGYQMAVQTVDSGKAAIALYEKEDFDLIFLDHMMPGMDGVETHRHLRRISEKMGKNAAIIAFTANAVSGAREMFLKEGFDEFISKPIEALEMDRILRKVLPKTAIQYEDIHKRNHPVLQKQNEKKQKKQDETKQNQPDTELEACGVRVRSGLQYCGADRRFYEEILVKFGEDASHKIQEMNGFYQREDYKNYGIRVHALKSTAKMIGADALSEQAKKLEMAAKEMNADYVKAYHEEIMEAYHQLALRILELFGKKPERDLQETGEKGYKAQENSWSMQQLLEMLHSLEERLGAYDVDKAEELFKDLNAAEIRENLTGELQVIRQCMDDYDFPMAAEETRKLIETLEGGAQNEN